MDRMASVDTESRIREFLAKSFGFRGATRSLNRQLDLLAEGILDSTAVLEVVAFMESQLGVTVEDDELVPDNLASIGNMVAFIDRKRRAAS